MMIAAQAPLDRRNLIFAALLLGGLVYLLYDYVYSPRAEEVAVLEERLDVLQQGNRSARALAAEGGRTDVERQLREYREQLDTVERLIPSSEELPDLLDAISAEARRTGVDLALIQPVGVVRETYYTRRVYDLAVIGPYHRIGEFLTQIASLPRIITPINMNVVVQEDGSQGGEPRLEARFSIETYVLPETTQADENLNAE